MNVKLIGSKAVSTVLLQITEDKYGDEDVEIIENSSIYCYINFPDNEVPMPQSGTTNTTSNTSNVIHLYDIIPITANIPFDANAVKGNVLLYKVKTGEGKYNVIPLQLLEAIGKGTMTDIVYIEWNIAPITNWELANSSAYETIVENFTSNDNW